MDSYKMLVDFLSARQGTFNYEIFIFVQSHFIYLFFSMMTFRTVLSISSWHDVNKLSKYPQLRALRLSHIPLFAGKGSSEVRPEVIARIKQLTFFNGSAITHRERVESEKNYLRGLFYEASTRSCANMAELDNFINHDLHPRFKDLMSLYGADLVMSATKVSVGPTNMASDIINITFRNLSFGSNGTLEPITKKVPRSLQISRLHLMIKQLYGLEPRLQHLSLRVHKDSLPVLLDDEKATLQYYGAADGAEIFINEGKE
jgi:hypothetical protein